MSERENSEERARVEDGEAARLVARIQSGDEGAFGALYGLYFDRVYAYLRIALRDPNEAEDVAQQVFLKVYEALPRYEERGRPFRAWLFTIVRNSARTRLRKLGRVDVVEPETLDTGSGNGGDDESFERVLGWISDNDLVTLVERLPVPQRQVLLLRFQLDLSAAEVGEILDRSEEDVRVLQHRALRFLEARLRRVGWRASRRRARLRGVMRQAPVLRERRFALASTR